MKVQLSVLIFIISVSAYYIHRAVKWKLEAGRFLRPNRRLLWQTGVLLQWTMGDSV